MGSGTSIYTNQQLPYSTNSFPGPAIIPFWDDLYVYQAQPQGIFYQYDGTSPTRSVTLEYLVSKYLQPAQYYHFTVNISESSSTPIVWSYYQISDSGSSATVGAQNEDCWLLPIDDHKHA